MSRSRSRTSATCSHHILCRSHHDRCPYDRCPYDRCTSASGAEAADPVADHGDSNAGSAKDRDGATEEHDHDSDHGDSDATTASHSHDDPEPDGHEANL